MPPQFSTNPPVCFVELTLEIKERHRISTGEQWEESVVRAEKSAGAHKSWNSR